VEASKDEFTKRDFWLPGFFDPKSFLTMLQQEVARKQCISIEQLAITYRVMDLKEEMLSHRKAASKNIYYVHGLYIYGAQWDADT